MLATFTLAIQVSLHGFESGRYCGIESDQVNLSGAQYDTDSVDRGTIIET